MILRFHRPRSACLVILKKDATFTFFFQEISKKQNHRETVFSKAARVAGLTLLQLLKHHEMRLVGALYVLRGA